MRSPRFLLIAVLFVCLPVMIVSCGPGAPLSLIGSSYVEGNVPPDASFDPYLKRDLEAYFSDQTGRKVTVDYELLRKQPTQVGVADPKYYAWVRVFESATLLNEGAVRVAADDKTHFDITDFVDRRTIETAPDTIYRIFPAQVCDRIKEKLK